MVDDTAYVQWHLDRGVPVPPGSYQVGPGGVLIPGDYLQSAAAAGRRPGSAGYPLSEPGDPAVLVLPRPGGGEHAIALAGHAAVTFVRRLGSGQPGCWIGRGGIPAEAAPDGWPYQMR